MWNGFLFKRCSCRLVVDAPPVCFFQMYMYACKDNMFLSVYYCLESDFIFWFFFFPQIDELSNFSDTPSPSVTRILYSKMDVFARRYL